MNESKMPKQLRADFGFDEERDKRCCHHQQHVRFAQQAMNFRALAREHHVGADQECRQYGGQMGINKRRSGGHDVRLGGTRSTSI